jgi:hypothetical protein
MQTLPAAAVFGLLPVPANECGGSGARSTATENLDVSRRFREEPRNSALPQLGDHLNALRDALEDQPIPRLRFL